ncbi:hypothetical protein EJD97_001564 [Solanum chilense]|uniref:Uncharacterized protein n=1 Tax=Solanum chilense TaxID=4083 RepID=A0A6N2C0G9_SOLCI|nr:hypothetical protein EJD97_001564 [Solanum chilense]
MAPKQDRVYARGRSKYVTPSACLVNGSDDERDQEYVPPGIASPSLAARAARATPKMVAYGIVTASQFDEKRTLTGTPSGSATHEEGAFGSLGVSWSEEAFGSAKFPAPATAEQSSSSDEADSSESTPSSPTRALTLVADQPNWWCVDGHYQVYSDAKFLNEKGVMTWTFTLEKRAPLEHVRVRGIQVDISLPAICRYLYSEYVDVNRTPLTAEFDYRWKIVKDGQFLCEPLLRETTKRWMALHLSVDGEDADNIVTWDRAVLMEAMIAGFEVDFAWLPQAVMHERSVGVPIWNIDQLKTPLGTVDIGLNKDETNELAPRRGPRPELPPLGDNLADTVAQARTSTQSASLSTDTTLVKFIPGSNTTPSSSRSASFPALVPLARVQKLEAHMATLLHHIQPWMQRVPESESPSAEPAEDTVMAALFATFEIPPPPPREHAKRRKVREEDEARARKKKHREMEATRRDSLAAEEACQMRVVESAAEASSSRNVEIEGGTAVSVVVDEDTT